MKRYDVIISGNKTTLLLSDADAQARGLIPAEPVPADESDVDTKAKTPANKGRRPANKRRADIAAQAFGAKDGDE